MVAPSPIGPAPKIDDLVGGLRSALVDAVAGHGHRFVERGHLERDVVGHDLEALAANRVLDEQVFGQRTSGAAVADDSARRGHRVDDDVVADRNAGDVAADLDDLARGLVAERRLPLPGWQPPIEMYRASDPQIPHARILTSTSFGPTVGFGTSTTRVSPGAVTIVAFIAALLQVVPGDQRRDVVGDHFGE